MSVCANIQRVRQNIPSHVQLVCVSKFHPNDAVLEAYNCGERVFGESKVQELVGKYESLPKDILWHFIGHLQTNKVKYIVPFVELIHGVDSVKLLAEIDKQAAKVGRIVNCLLQVHIAQEETKFGFDERELYELFEKGLLKECPNVSVCGLMGMATFTDNGEQVRAEFKTLKTLFDKLKRDFFTDKNDFSTLSMGMSDDYPIAIEEGSTLVRIGTTIFGMREY
ncbi:YggS family pyridoxal phosphate-dependent enzyme [Paludibacter sp. 221]|uniref:YggS family pyridoxal phosphate-dependent enzyme n=1 Tax=Paludibacter sp. 221 TaxID=2302939 RepID=UPI0013D1FCFD|nr:YggS family pyridoxal phosphate-dependent enzyme [Paludibacter sp. 221]NDV46898.1 YggS family pyridoxal phosphate-dependent enzyme [Paludibacter sp. 221]